MATAFDDSELGRIDAVDTAHRIRKGMLKATEVIGAAIARARALEPALNAIPTERFDAALNDAERPATGPFSGVPTFVKALDDVKGQINDYGSRAQLGHVARRTEPFVARFLETGLVSLGRSAAPETGLNATTETLAHGPTRNPWNLDHSVGGSSGGAAALVAARVVPISMASDAAGSIRIPASACGIVGLKPSRGRRFQSTAARLLPVPIFTYGAVTRSVRDSAHFLSEMEARIPTRKLPRVGLVEGPDPARLRVGLFVDSPLGEAIDPEVREATLAAGRALDALGHGVEEIPCPWDPRIIDDTWIHIGLIAWGFAQQTRMALRGRYDPAAFEPWTRGLIEYGKAHTRSMPGVVRRLRSSRRVSAALFRRFDAVLCPTLGTPPPAIGEIAPDRPFEATLEKQKRFIPFTPIQNATGDPAISLPTAVTAAGLPIGVQLATEPGGERRLLSLAYELEGAGRLRLAD